MIPDAFLKAVDEVLDNPERTQSCARLPATSMKPLTSDVADKIRLAKPDDILQMRFLYDANTPGSGTWEVESYAKKKGGVVV